MELSILFQRRIRRALFATCAVAAAVSSAAAATLSFDVPLHLQPEFSSPTVAVLPAGSSITALLRDELTNENIAPLPPGWVAVRFPGPLEGWVRNDDVAKDLTVKSGGAVHTTAAADAPVFTMVGEKETADVVETSGDWSKVSVRKELVLFLTAMPPPAHAAPEPVLSTATPMSETAPSLPTVEEQSAVSAPSRPAPKPPPQPVMLEATPRVFQGYLARTRRILGAGPKLDYQLVDEHNERIALLDLSALLVTEPLDGFEGRQVSVFGPAMRRSDIRDLIIRVQTLRLAR